VEGSKFSSVGLSVIYMSICAGEGGGEFIGYRRISVYGYVQYSVSEGLSFKQII